jgi:dihydrolipoamide dehydrogenase
MHDVLVIGGGPGGYAAAIRASQLGGKVALAEAHQIGGVCVNRGCIPTKVWQRTAYLLYWIHRAAAFGIETSPEKLHLDRIVARKDGVSGDIRMGMEGLLRTNGVEVFRGRAAFKSARQVLVDGATLEAERMILAPGSALRIPDIPGLDEAALTTDQVLEMREIPSSVLVWGSPGPIELEIASLLNILGSHMILASESRKILPREDGDTSQRLAQALREQGVEVLPRFRLHRVQKAERGYLCTSADSDERSVQVERVLVAERQPNLAHLGLEQTGIRLNDDGSVWVNEMLETSTERIYAIGDVTGGWMLSQAASSMGIIAAENAMGQRKKFRSHLVPRAIWTIPEVGAVGLSEEAAEARGIEVEVGDFPYAINGLAMARDQMAGAVKIVSDARYGEILGVHIVGAGATELIGEAVLAMQLDARAQELAAGMRAHPTFSESVVDAARDVEGWALYLPRR